METLTQKGLLHRRGEILGLFEIDSGFSAFPNLQVFLKRKWSGLLFELDFRGEGPRAVSEACARRGFSTAVCMNIDANSEHTYNIKLDAYSLESVHNSFHMPSYAIVEEDERFLIVSDSDYYWSIVGERAFVESVFEMPWNDLLSNFERGIERYQNSDRPDQKRIWDNLSRYASLCRSTFTT